MKQARKKQKKAEHVTVFGSHWLCARCAEKLSKTQEVEETEEYRAGRCEGCGKFYSLSRYRSRPYPRPQYRRKSGGGERARAGGEK